MCYYCRVPPSDPVYLLDNKRPAAIILLSGHVGIFTRNQEMKREKGKKMEEFIKM